MSKGINKVILVGRLGADPDIRSTPSGTNVTKLSVATSNTWKDKNTGDKNEQTEWHRVAMFGSLADIAGKYLTKGSQVYIEGSLKTTKWQDKKGNDRYTTEIMANDLQMLGTKNTISNDVSSPTNNTMDDDLPF